MVAYSRSLAESKKFLESARHLESCFSNNLASHATTGNDKIKMCDLWTLILAFQIGDNFLASTSTSIHINRSRIADSANSIVFLHFFTRFCVVVDHQFRL